MGLIKNALRKWLFPDLAEKYSISMGIGSEWLARLNNQVDFSRDFAFLGGSAEEAIEAAATCYACIVATARAIGTLPAVVQRRGKGTEPAWVTAPRTAKTQSLYDLLDYPVGRGRSVPVVWSWGQLAETVIMGLETGGNAFLRKVVYGSQITSLIPYLDPKMMTPDLDPITMFPRWYYYRGLTRIRPGQLVNIMYSNPSSYWRGLSPLDAAGADLAIVRVAKTRTAYNLKNRVGSGLVFKVGSLAGGANKPQLDKMRDDLAENYQQSFQDGKPLVVGKATEIEKMPIQGHGSEIIEARRMSAADLRLIFGVPGPIIGDYAKAPLQKLNLAFSSWWNTSLEPKAKRIYESINLQAVWPIHGSDHRLWFDISDAMIGLLVLEAKAAVAQTLVALGYPTNAAAARVDLGMPYYPELDELNTQMILAGRGGTEEKADKAAKDEEREQEKEIEELEKDESE